MVKKGNRVITIDYQDRRPIYEQIVQRYELLIVKGVLAPDTQMPSVRQLAQELSINPNTIQKALSILESRGFIYPVKGRGNFVSGNDRLAEQKRSAWTEKMQELLSEGKEFGVSKAEAEALVREAFKGGEA